MASCYTPGLNPGGVAESADAPDLKSGSFRSVGSSPTAPTDPKLLQNNTFFIDGKEPPASRPGASAAMRQQ